MFKITETTTPNIDEYWEIKPQYEMSKNDLMTTEIRKEHEIYISVPQAGNWGETHVNQNYNNEVYSKIPQNGFILDIGCGGGGFVEQCVQDGYKAVGIEIGKGYEKTESFSWRTIPENLFIRDFGQPLKITYNNKPVKFDFIHSWDVFEHIRESDIPQVCKNMRNHCHEDTILVHKIAIWRGYSHRTAYDENWWWNHFNNIGFIKHDQQFHHALRERDGLMFYMKVKND
jgi:2-polyprenyl-3-methyl-5-hydroxy-6-metoxy-1,4-benzoquinol methylase